MMAFYVPAIGQYNITYFGASANGKTDNRQAIQKVIDKCASDGGGTVIVPAGTFFTGAFRLRSNVELRLESGATLQASTRKEDYVLDGRKNQWLISATNARKITISGRGKVLGTGETDGAVKRGVTHTLPKFRPGLIHLEDCEDVVIKDIELKYADFFTVLMNYCENVKIHGITIQNNYFHPNSDGIDLGNCKNVIISDCKIIAGDDCICFKEGAENVLVNNCILSTPSSAIKFGTSTSNIFRRIRVNNCVITNSMVGIGIYMKDGGMIDDVGFSNISIQDIQDTSLVNSGIVHQQAPILIDIDKRNKDSSLGTVRNIRFSNISIDSYNSILIQGMKEKNIENVYLEDIYFKVSGPFSFEGRKKPKGFADEKFLYHSDHRLTEFVQKESYITIANVNGAEINDIYVVAEDAVYDEFARHAVFLSNVENVTTSNIKRSADKEEKFSSIVQTE